MSLTLWQSPRETTQNDELLALLRDPFWRLGITALEALEEVGTMRLAARIHDLRAAGHHIVDETVAVRARNGRVAHVKRYRLVK